MSQPPRIVAMAADHNGIAAKAFIKAGLKESGYHCVDLGPYETGFSVDYVDYARQASVIVHAGEADRGILICGTGVGMSIVANKVPGVRAALVHNMDTALKCREHNDANVLCLGAWVLDDESNLDIARAWLAHGFGEYRHVRRVERIDGNPGHRIVFTNGIFDILHQGHVQLLQFAKSLGDYLVVGLNSDRSVRDLKGPGRPVNSERDRKAVLESMRHVDEVIVFDELQPTELLRTVNPAVVVKGGEWTADQVRERDGVPDHVAVKVFPIVKGYSSSGIIEHIRQQ